MNAQLPKRALSNLPAVLIGLLIAFALGCRQPSTPPPTESDADAPTERNAANPDATRPAPAKSATPTPNAATTQTPSSTSAVPGYIDDSTCADCHRDLYDSYAHVGMSRSFYRPSPDNLIESWDDAHFVHEESNRHYEMSLRDGTMFFQRWQLTDDGQRINEIERKIDWIVGSGNHVRTYLYQTESGEVFQLPLCWYSQDGKWAMAPGYDRKDHNGIMRSINRECMFCHNAYPDVPAGADAFGRLPIFPKELPQGLGCQRCHGPGEAHVRLANHQESTLGQVREAIVNPARLPPKLRDDVCYQCHLQPTVLHSSLVRRFGRADFSYRPGEPLEDYLVHLDFDDGREPSARFEINHHAYRLRQSRCFTESGDALSCLTCHDPHRKVSPSNRAAFYRAKCLTCHQLDDCRVDAMAAGDTPIDDCISCHMPSRRPEDVVHVVMTDHLIQRGPPDPDRLLIRPERHSDRPAPAKLYFPNRGPQEPEAAVYRAMSPVLDDHLPATMDLYHAITTADSPEVEPRLLLSSAFWRIGRLDNAANTLAPILRRDLDNVFALVQMGITLAEARQFENALPYFNRALDREPNSPENHYHVGRSLVASGETERGIDHLRRAIGLRENYVEPMTALGSALGRLGQSDEAIQVFRAAASFDPRVGTIYRNWGILLRQEGELTAAARVFRHGVSMAPNDAYLSATLATEYLISRDASLRDDAEALRLIERAVRFSPNDPGLFMILAFAMLRNGEFQEAIPAATKSRQGGADTPTGLFIAAAAQARLGDATNARETFRIATQLGNRDDLRDPVREAARQEAQAALDTLTADPP